MDPRGLGARIRARVHALLGAEVPSSRPACAGLWDTPMVQVDGRVTTCCLDEGLENVIGNVRDTPLVELWHGATMHRWRVAHAEGRFADSGPFCTRCNWRGAGAMPTAAVADYLTATGERSTLRRFRSRIRNAPSDPDRKSR